MTSPVVMEPSKPGVVLAMTAPVLQAQDLLSFVLPFEYDLQSLPLPTDPRVSLRTVQPKVVAVKHFSGWYYPDVALCEYRALKAKLIEDKLLSDAADQDLHWSVAQYHPPFTLPFLRRNEIWIELDVTNSEVSKMIT